MKILEYIGYILLAIGILMLMITIHELGHYIAGRILKFKITEFSIGFGPKLFSKKKKNGEVFSIRAIPLGGFCAFEGEDEDDAAGSKDADKAQAIEVFEEDKKNAELDAAEKARQKKGVVRLAGSITGTVHGDGLTDVNPELKNFNDQKPWKRIVVLASGAFFNLVSAVLFCFIFIWAVGMPQPQISMLSVDQYGNQYVTQLEAGDVITHVDGKSMDLDYLFSGSLAKSSAKEIIVTVIRANGKTEELKLNRRDVIRREDASNKNSSILRDDNGKIIYTDIKDNDGKVVAKSVTDNKGNIIYAVIVDEIGEIITKPVNDVYGNVYYLVTDEYATGEGGNLIYNYMTDKDGNLISRLVKNDENEFVYDSLFGVSLTSHFKKGFTNALKRSVPLTGKMSWMVLSTLGQLLTGQLSCTAVSGPIGTISGIAEGAAMGGWQFILVMLPLIAANLGVFNLLPVPALDGSKIIFCFIEWIRKKPINRKVENMIHAIGLLVLLGLVILVDISGLFVRCGL